MSSCTLQSVGPMECFAKNVFYRVYLLVSLVHTSNLSTTFKRNEFKVDKTVIFFRAFQNNLMQ